MKDHGRGMREDDDAVSAWSAHTLVVQGRGQNRCENCDNFFFPNIFGLRTPRCRRGGRIYLSFGRGNEKKSKQKPFRRRQRSRETRKTSEIFPLRKRIKEPRVLIGAKNTHVFENTYATGNTNEKTVRTRDLVPLDRNVSHSVWPRWRRQRGWGDQGENPVGSLARRRHLNTMFPIDFIVLHFHNDYCYRVRNKNNTYNIVIRVTSAGIFSQIRRIE